MNEQLVPSEACIAVIEEGEGLRLMPYFDVAGVATIGRGHRLLPGEEFPHGITLEQANALFEQDLGNAAAGVRSAVAVALTQGQFDALVDFVFNLGEERLRTSTLLRELNAGSYALAGAQILLWDHAGGVEAAGLKLRREKDYALWTAGEQPAA